MECVAPILTAKCLTMGIMPVTSKKTPDLVRRTRPVPDAETDPLGS